MWIVDDDFWVMPIHYNSNQSYAFEIYSIFKTNINLICNIMNH